MLGRGPMSAPARSLHKENKTMGIVIQIPLSHRESVVCGWVGGAVGALIHPYSLLVRGGQRRPWALTLL